MIPEELLNPSLNRGNGLVQVKSRQRIPQSRNSVEIKMSCRVCSQQNMFQLEVSGRTCRASVKGNMVIYVEGISWCFQTSNKEHDIKIVLVASSREGCGEQ